MHSSKPGHTRVVVASLALLLAPAARTQALDPVPGRILTSSGPDTVAVLMALGGAQRKLRDPECQKVLTDFRDAEGRTLAERLAWLEMEPADYITVLYIRDGSESGARQLCRTSGAAAATIPNTRHVFVCGSSFRHQPRRTRENTLIHEMLHSLGLGEDPPSSYEINAQVVRRCGI